MRSIISLRRVAVRQAPEELLGDRAGGRAMRTVLLLIATILLALLWYGVAIVWTADRLDQIGAVLLVSGATYFAVVCIVLDMREGK